MEMFFLLCGFFQLRELQRSAVYVLLNTATVSRHLFFYYFPFLLFLVSLEGKYAVEFTSPRHLRITTVGI